VPLFVVTIKCYTINRSVGMTPFKNIGHQIFLSTSSGNLLLGQFLASFIPQDFISYNFRPVYIEYSTQTAIYKCNHWYADVVSRLELIPARAI
ncbi:hypothetical protein L9F63_015582, partial [Diploptera punctata]